MIKICSKCKEEKPLSEFNRKDKTKYQTYCKICDNAIAREYYAKNGDRLRKQINQARKIRVKNTKEYVKDLKESSPCADCGKKYPYYVMDFDHQRDKEILISRAVGDGSSLTKIKKEIEKCEIVCANCHRIRTFNNMKKK
jgi:hypothetical protein